METVVIDVLRTPEMQRLRRIRQLGLSYFVFPGAEHSRLSHSLGAAYLAIRFGRHLEEACKGSYVSMLCPSQSTIKDLAVAALCHDLGHGPLSHAWEREIIGKDFDFDKWVAKLGVEDEKEILKGAKWHEIVGYSFLAWEDGKLHRLLERHEDGTSKRVRQMLRGKYFLPYLPRLLNSDIDVDRADFLKRDAHLSGVAYGRYDLDWLISTCAVGEAPGGDLVVGFDRKKAIRVIEQFIIARHALYETVYYHKTVRSAEGMVALFLKRLKTIIGDYRDSIKVEGFVKPLIDMIAGEALEQHELLALDDYSLWVLIENIVKINGMDETVLDLGKRILERNLFKLVPCSSEKVSDFLTKGDGHQRIYDAIQPFCRGEKEYYLVVDEPELSILCEDAAEMGYLIDEDKSASPIRDHDELLMYRQRNHIKMVRIFTVQEAVDAVAKLIG